MGKLNLLSIVMISMALLVTGCDTTMLEAPSPAQKQLKKKNMQQASQVNVQLGLAYFRNGSTERGQQKLLLAQKQSPNDINVLSALGRYYSQTGQEEQALSYYLKALKIAPGSGRAHNNYGVFLCRTGKIQQAIEEFLVAANNPRYESPAEAFENAGLCALKLPDTLGAEKYFKLALKRDAHRESAVLELSRLAYQRGLYQSAHDYLEKYNSLAKPNAASLTLGIKIAERLGDKHAVVKQRLMLNSLSA